MIDILLYHLLMISGPKGVLLKARTGRGLRMQALADALHSDLTREFKRLRMLGVTLRLTTLQLLASQVFRVSAKGAYSVHMVYRRAETPLHEKII